MPVEVCFKNARLQSRHEMSPHLGETVHQALWLRCDTPGHSQGERLCALSIGQLQHEVDSAEV